MELYFYNADVWFAAGFAFILILVALVYLTIKAHRNKVQTGWQGLTGERGKFQGGGLVLIHGELWHVENDDKLKAGDLVEVVAVDRLVLKVRKIQG